MLNLAQVVEDNARKYPDREAIAMARPRSDPATGIRDDVGGAVGLQRRPIDTLPG